MFLHVLIIAQYYPPDLSGTSTKAYNAAQGLKDQGCKVTVLTAFPLNENRTLKILSAFTINDGKDIYRINYAADPWKYDEYLPIAKRMIDSFQFSHINLLRIHLTHE